MHQNFDSSHLPDISSDTQDPLQKLIEWSTAEEEFCKLQLLQPNCATKLLIPKNQPIKTIVLLFHGFASGTWVFEEWINSISTESILIIAPRLPGSGYMTNGIPNAKYLPGSDEIQAYEEMVTKWITICQIIGGNIHLIGHSSGGTIAYRFSQKTEVKSMFLIAPFFDTEDSLAQTIFSVTHWLKLYLRLPIYRLLNHLQWTLKETFNTGLTHLPGHSVMTIGNLYSIYTYAKWVYELPQLPQTQSVWITASEYDTRARIGNIKAIIRRLKKAIPIIKTNITIFQKVRQVPHAMIHPFQNNQDEVTGFLKGQFIQWINQVNR